MRLFAIIITASALSAHAQDVGFFPQHRDRGEPSALKVLACRQDQSMSCQVRCPAPADGRIPNATACEVVKCECDDATAKVNVSTTAAPVAIVTFNLRELLGLPRTK